MEFGLFVQAHVPRHEVEADPVGAEHSRLMRELELAEACDRAGWKYVWSVEHHFLEEYSHISASEIFLPYVAARTKRIHVGSAIYNITPPVNHPARIAERVAMLDHLSEGRFEFGTGRGSSSTEFKGFGIPDGDTTRAMFDESLREILRMWRETHYSYEGKYFSMPERNVLPKPYTQAASADLGGVRQPVDVREGGAPRPRRALLQPRLAEGLRAADQGLQGQHQARRAGRRLRERQRRLRHRAGLPRGRQARRARSRSTMGSGYHTSLVFRYLDTFPRPAGVPAWPQLIPEPTPGAARGAHRQPASASSAIPTSAPRRCSSTPTSAATRSSSASSPRRSRRRWRCDSVELFGKHVIPRFDKDPVHSTTRMREAARVTRDGAMPSG